jgi:hypothetical protein
MKVEADEFPPELRWKLGAWALRAELRVGNADLGLKPPPRSSMWLRVRTASENGAIDPIGLSYTQGTAAMTLYAASPTDVLDATGTFDPIYSLLDAVVETAWYGRIQLPWELPNALRLGLDRHFAQPLLDVLQDEEKKDATLPRWPGAAKARKGSLENLPADHPLVQDRDHVLDVLARFEAKFGRARIAQHLLDCNQRVLTTEQVTVATEKLLEPITAELGKPLLPVATFETRVPWKGEGAEPPDSRLNGLAGEVPYLDDYQLRVCYGEQRASARTFQPWAAGGAPTLFFRIPLTGTWTISGVELLGRLLVEEGKPYHSAQRLWRSPSTTTSGSLNLVFQQLWRSPRTAAGGCPLEPELLSGGSSREAGSWPGHRSDLRAPDAVAEHSGRSSATALALERRSTCVYADIRGRRSSGAAPRAVRGLEGGNEAAAREEPQAEGGRREGAEGPAKKRGRRLRRAGPPSSRHLAADGIDREKREVRVEAILRQRVARYPIEHALVTNEGQARRSAWWLYAEPAQRLLPRARSSTRIAAPPSSASRCPSRRTSRRGSRCRSRRWRRPGRASSSTCAGRRVGRRRSARSRTSSSTCATGSRCRCAATSSSARASSRSRRAARRSASSSPTTRAT